MFGMILFCIFMGIFLLLVQILIIPWNKFSHICIGIQIACLFIQFGNLIRHLNWRKKMRKDTCDCCGNDLVYRTKEDSGFLALISPVSIFKVKAVYKIMELSIMLPFGCHHRDLDMCSKCMDDFKEFVQRKQSYQAGDKR